MIRQNKNKIIISSLLILLPILIAFIFWDKIPDVLLTHWNLNGVANGETKKSQAVFFIPLIFFLAHFICILSAHFDKRNKNQSSKIFNLILWLFPILSNFVSLMIYLTSIGKNISVINITFILMSILFIVMGNYIPKCKQNLTIGVRIKWTLESEKNWNATHRFTGKIWMVVGVLMLFTALLPLKYTIIAFISEMFIAIIPPIIYSYRFSKKDTDEKKSVSPVTKKTKIISIIISCMILVFSAILMGSGDIDVKFRQSDFTIATDWWQDLTVEYRVIESVYIKEDLKTGIRTFGLGSARLLAGSFSNDEFGLYTLYAYTGAKSHVVIETSKFGTLVISGKSNDETLKIFNELNERI